MAEVKSARCAIFAIVILQSLSLPVVEAAVNSSLPVGGAKGTVSAPRNLSRSVIGVLGDNRKFRVLWTASKDNGGLPVNYTVKLCLKDYSDCRNSGSPDCHVTNVVSPSKEFRCVLSESDFWFLGPFGEFSEHNLCVEASNVAGKSKTCIHADFVGGYVATPRPPLNFRVGLENGQFTVRWGERTSWKVSPVIKRLYTVAYYPSSKKLKTKVVTDRTIAILTDLEPYTEYCVLLFIQFENEDGDKTAPSDRLGPLCSKTPAGEPSNRPQVVAYKNYLFPENPRVRDVAVEWKLALPSSWNGTPGQFVICCDCPSVGKQNAQAKKCEYHANATANSTVLRGLNSGNDYLVSMEKCNEEGKCSGRGRPYRIEAVRGDERKPPKIEKISKAQIAGISLSIIPGVAFAVGAVYMIRKWRRERRPLDEFHYGEDEPDGQHEYCEINERKNEYDRVAGKNERVDIV